MIVFFSEAEYAFQLKKKNYNSSREWLGLINGTKLYYEFTDKYPFEEKMNGLLKEVLKNHQKSVHQKPVFFSRQFPIIQRRDLFN